MNNSKPYQKTVLPNGVRLLLIPMEGVNSVATSVMVGVGSRYEDTKNNGISHFLEHMVFKGTKKFPTTDDVNVIERQGGLQNAYTDIDITNYHNKVLASDWELGLEINKELALNPLLEQQHVDRERDVILEEMKRYEDEPSAKAEETFHTQMYPGTSLGMRTIGEVEPLMATTSKELRGYHDKWYSASRIVVVLAGKFQNSQLSTVNSQLESWFGGLPKYTPESSYLPVTDNQSTPLARVVTKPDAQQAHFVLGLRTFKRGSDDRFAWSVFNLLMGVSFTSRLFREIREKRGLCYHIRSSSNNWSDVGYWSIYAGVATTKVEEALKSTLEELSKVRSSGVTEEEVNVAKKRLATMIAFRTEDPEFLNEYYGRQELFGEPIIAIDDYLARIDAVTKVDIDALLKKYLIPSTLNFTVVWNKKGGEESLQKLLTI